MRDDTCVLADAVLARWCDDALGTAPRRVLFRRRHLSQVVALELADGRRVVVKARPFQERVAGCVSSGRAGPGWLSVPGADRGPG